jgi:hypothetical protein
VVAAFGLLRRLETVVARGFTIRNMRSFDAPERGAIAVVVSRASSASTGLVMVELMKRDYGSDNPRCDRRLQGG